MDTRITLTIPEELYRQAKRLARSLNRDVAQVLAEAIQLETVAADVPETPEMVAEREAFLELHPQLVEKHHGDYVAIHGGQLVDHDPELGALSARINRRYPNKFVLVRPVLSNPEIEYRFRAPGLVR